LLLSLNQVNLGLKLHLSSTIASPPEAKDNRIEKSVSRRGLPHIIHQRTRTAARTIAGGMCILKQKIKNYT